MHDSLSDIRRYVKTLATRERALLLSRVVLQSAALLVVLLFLVVLAAALRWDHGVAALVLVMVGGAGLWAAVVAPVLVGWRTSGDLLRQARLAEALRPELEGRLVTAVERLEGPRGQESAAILGLIARRAVERVSSLRPGRVHRSWPLAVLGAGVFAGLLVTVVSGVFAPGGIAGTWRFWLGEDVAQAAAEMAQKGSADNARVGDLVLEYVYPTYTGLEPLQVTNSTGEAHGPPGTQVRVRARSAEPIDGGAVVAYDEPSAESRVEDRIIRGTFTIQDSEGGWYLELLQGESTRTSREFPITPEPDLPPEVLVDAPRRMEVALDQPLQLPWQARDDYGLSRVVLIVDGKEERELRTITERQAEASGTVGFSPAQLGMSVGMVVKVQVGAWDNNGWAGAQLGANEPAIEIVVKNAEDLAMLGAEERRELRDTLVDLLAGQVTDPWPPAGTSAAVARAGERYHDLYEPLERFLERTPGVQRDRSVRRMVRRVVRSGQDFITYTQVNFDPRLSEQIDKREPILRAGELRGLSIEENEHTIIWLDRFIQMRALGETVEEAQTMARLGSQLQRALERGASDAEIASALERVDRSLDKLGEAVSGMDQDSTRSMVERRASEIGLVKESVEAAQQAGDREEAASMAARMARQMEELNQDLEYRLRQLEDEEDELAEEMKSLMEELQRLEREQRQLQEEVRQVRAGGDAQGAAEAERMWSQIERLATEAEDRGQRMEDALERSGGLFMFQTRVEAGRRASGRLAESAAARDLRKAQRDAQEAMENWSRARSGVPEGARRQVTRRLEQAQRLLDQLDREASSVDPRTAAQARALEGQQQELNDALEAATEQAQQVAAQMPIEPRGMEEALEKADGSMKQAGQDLNQGRPMPAEGSQGQAAERIKEAREALEQAAAEMASSGSGAREGEGEGEGEGEKGENDGSDPLDLDDPSGGLASDELTLEEEFDLDAFQRDVLRGARGDVPEAYRAMKKRYYEELMTQ